MTTPSRNPPPSPRSTVEDVAAAAGESVVMVTRALRGLPNVPTATRQHISNVAQQLHYFDPAESGFASSGSVTVAVIVPLLHGWFCSRVISGVEAVCSAEDADVVVMGVDQRAERPFGRIATLHRRANAIIAVDVDIPEREIWTMREHGVAVVSVGRYPYDVPTVGVDNERVGEMAAEYLIGLGHRRIGLISGLLDNPHDYEVPFARINGFERVCEEAGIERHPADTAPGHFTLDGGANAVAALLGQPDPPTAIFALSDEMAIGAIDGARQLGLDVPGDLSLIGVDDHEMSRVMGLTTIRQDVAGLGARSGRLALSILDGATVPNRRFLDPIELIVRSSTAPPRH